jgi:hypothetical protein
MMLLHPCPTCPNGLVARRATSCLRCVAAFEAEFNPFERHQPAPKRLTWWQRIRRQLPEERV